MKWRGLFVLGICILIMACSNNRQKMTASEALIGHWKSEGGTTEYYFDENRWIMVDRGKKHEPVQYVIIWKSYPDRLVIEIKTSRIKNLPKKDIFMGHRKNMVFSKDRRTVLVDTMMGGIVNGEIKWASLGGEELWRYVDEKQNP